MALRISSHSPGLQQGLEGLPVLAVDQRLEGGLGRGLQPARLDQLLARLLAGGGVEEEGQQHRRRAVDGHRDRGLGVAEVEARVQPFGVLDGADRDPGLADLAPDVGAGVGVLAVEGDRVEGGGEAVDGLAVGEEVEALVGALGAALAREHPGRQLGGAFEGEDAGGVGEGAGDVFQEHVAEDAGPGLPLGELDLGHLGAGERGGGEGDVDFFAAHGVGELAAGEVVADPRPGGDQLARVVLELVGEPADLGIEIAELGLAGDLGGGDLFEEVPQVLG